MKPTNEQTKEFWEWCGLIYKDEVGYHGWYKGFGFEGSEWVADELPIDLNNLFLYAVPKVARWEMGNNKDSLTYAVVCAKGQQFPGQAQDKDPALALFWALNKVKDGR